MFTQENNVKLSENLVTGNGEWVRFSVTGRANIITGGNFAGALIQLQARHLDLPSNIVDLLKPSIFPEHQKYIEEASTFTVELTNSHEIRLVTTGGGGAQSITAIMATKAN